MPLTPWYKVVEPRPEVMRGRSFSPDEFAIALEQVVAGNAPEDYRDPAQFLSRTVFTGALKKHLGMVLRRLDGRTANTAPVLSLVTQFGGGKTHTLTALYHLVSAEPSVLAGLDELRRELDLGEWPGAKPAVFVGGAWDPKPGRETPWMDLASQLAGDAGLAALGDAARTTPPGTDALARVFAAASGPVLILFDEVLNYLNRHRGVAAEQFHAFLQNLTVATTGAERAVAVVSLPRSQIEMTEYDLEWQGRITKLVKRVAQDLMANDESDISEVVRRRLFSDLGDRKVRRKVAKAYAQWCFERSARLPPEWLAADAAAGSARAREVLTRRFEACYPFHPATLSVFRRKWQTLPQFQQTRGALAMLAQWVSLAVRKQLEQPRKEPLITLGSAPLGESDFRAVVLGQLGESRLDAAIGADLTGETARCLPLDEDARGPLHELHRRVGAAILFESSGGQVDKVAHLPELRFALGGPDLDTTSIDNAANALETNAFFIRRDGTDGYRIHHEPTLTKVVADRRASLDDREVGDQLRKFVRKQFEMRGTTPRRTGLVFFPEDGAEVPDAPKLTLVVLDPATEWRPDDPIAKRLAEWTARRGLSPRLHSGCLVWCVRTPGRGLEERIETWLAWKRVKSEVERGDHGRDHPLAKVSEEVRNAEKDARDEVWAGYRVLAIADRRDPSGLRILDLGAGHASSKGALPDHLLGALKSEGVLNETVGAGYIDRHWPPQFADSGAWPLAGLRQSFLSGALTRLFDTDEVLKTKIPEFVRKREFGLASMVKDDGRYERLWYGDLVASEEVAFDNDVYLLTRQKAEAARKQEEEPPPPPDDDNGKEHLDSVPPEPVEPDPPAPARTTTLRLTGSVPPESWNRLGASIISRMRAGGKPMQATIDLSVTMPSKDADTLERDLRRQLTDLNLTDSLRVQRTVDPDEQ